MEQTNETKQYVVKVNDGSLTDEIVFPYTSEGRQAAIDECNYQRRMGRGAIARTRTVSK